MHKKFMQYALKLAKKGRYTCSPNPMVGCVIVKDGEIVGEGWHKRPGGAHAETHALNQAGHAALNATVFVNLEPCSHHGKTPPCVDALIKAKVGHVVIGCLDGHKSPHGCAVKILQQAGIKVTVGVEEKESQAINRIFFHNINQHSPYVIAKFAMSIDGKLATHSGDSKWLTGQEARNHVHQWRHRVDAILVGSGTVIKDNPQLTVRLADLDIQPEQQPIRIILDGKQPLPPAANIFSPQSPKNTLLASDILNDHQGSVNLSDLLTNLYKRNIYSLIVEGGPRTLTQFFENNLVDEIHCYIAPKLVGGAHAPTAFMGAGHEYVSAAERFSLFATKQFADDFLLVYRKHHV